MKEINSWGGSVQSGFKCSLNSFCNSASLPRQQRRERERKREREKERERERERIELFGGMRGFGVGI